MASTVRLNLLLSESDEVSKRDVDDVEQSQSYVEKLDTVITIGGGVHDVEVVSAQLASSKVLVLRILKDGATVDVRLNANDNTTIEGVALLVLNATGISALFLDNQSNDPVKVRINLYGDS